MAASHVPTALPSESVAIPVGNSDPLGPPETSTRSPTTPSDRKSPAVGSRSEETSIGAGLPLASFSSAAPEQAERQRGRRERPNLKVVDREIALLVERLAQTGLLEYRLSTANKDLAIIEPQVAGYWPKPAKCAATDTIVLSRFAYLRRRGNDLVLESPRAAALFNICDPKLAGFLATLSSPRKIGELRKQSGFPGLELIGLLLDCDILFGVGKDSDGLRPSEGDEKLVVWDFRARKPLQTLTTGGAPLECRWSLKEGADHGFANCALEDTLWVWEGDGRGAYNARKLCDTGKFPVDLSQSPDGKYLYVSCFMSDEVQQWDVSDPKTPKLTSTLKPGEQPNMLHLTHDGKRMYITNSLLSTMDHSDKFWVRLARVGPGGLSLDKKFDVDLTKFPTGPARGHDMLLR